MSQEEAEPRFDIPDFELLERLARSEGIDDELERDARESWRRARRLLAAAARVADVPGIEIEVWPWREDGDACPFLWARLKHRERSGHAAHVGLFLSPDHCNLAVDLEKDRLEDGTSEESLDDVLVFYREHAPAVLSACQDDRLRVWTDLDNVLDVDEFLAADFSEFMAAGRDEEHPWPRTGYLLQREELEAHPDDQVRNLGGRLRHLLPVYDALLASCED